MKHVRPNVSQFAAQWTQAQPITEPGKTKLKPRPRRRNRIPILETPDLPHEEREADENVSVEAVNDGKRWLIFRQSCKLEKAQGMSDGRRSLTLNKWLRRSITCLKTI